MIDRCMSSHHAALVKKYNQVMQRYFVQYLSGYDAIVLNELIQASTTGISRKYQKWAAVLEIE